MQLFTRMGVYLLSCAWSCVRQMHYVENGPYEGLKTHLQHCQQQPNLRERRHHPRWDDDMHYWRCKTNISDQNSHHALCDLTSISSFSRAGAGLYSGSSTSLNMISRFNCLFYWKYFNLQQEHKGECHIDVFHDLNGIMSSPIHEVIASLFSCDGLLIWSPHTFYKAQSRVRTDGVVLFITWKSTWGHFYYLYFSIFKNIVKHTKNTA